MTAVTIRIDDKLKARFRKICKEQGLNMSHFMRQALEEKLEELEDFYAVTKRLKGAYKTISHENLVKEMGLED